MNTDIFMKMLAGEDMADVLIEEPNTKYQIEVNAIIATIADVLINKGLITNDELEIKKAAYLKAIKEQTKKQLQKEIDKIKE